MEIKGKFANGVFVPNPAYENVYRVIRDRLESSGQVVSISFSKPVKRSEKQLALFDSVVVEAAKKSGHTQDEILQALEPIRLKTYKKGHFHYIPFNRYTTAQFSTFIDQAVVFLNDRLDLNIEIN